MPITVTTSKGATRPGEPTRSGRAVITTDAEGGFETPALAEGTVSVRVAIPKEEIPDLEDVQEPKKGARME